MQRNIIRAGFEAIQAGRFADALAVLGPVSAGGAGAVLHALALAGSGDVAGGAVAMDAVARANPAARHPVLDLIEVLERIGQGDEGGAHLRAAVALRPGDARVWGALGAAVAECGPIEAAVAAFERVVALGPGDAGGWSNLGKARAAAGLFEAAEAASARAVALAPGDARVVLNHGIVRLKAGRLAEGWALLRARTRLPGRAAGLPGEELRSLEGVRGRTVLLVHDEGFGDTLQFIRYAPMLNALGARVLVVAPPPLRRLLMASGIEVVGAGGIYDAWVRIPDLPGVFGTSLESIPAPFRLVAGLGVARPGRRRVGLVWAGAAREDDLAAAAMDRQRSIDPGLLGPLLAVPGVEWVSLQYGRPALPGLIDAMAGVADFADTAGIVAGLDLVVSVDTAVAHLAAGLGVPVVLMDRFDHCWRWLPGREDSPWYPGTVRVVRQASPGDWGGVVARVAGLV